MPVVPHPRSAAVTDAASAASTGTMPDPVARTGTGSWRAPAAPIRAGHLTLVSDDDDATRQPVAADASGLRALFVESLPVIDRIVAVIARRHALGTADADEFRSWAQERIIANGYAVLGKFAGRSSLATYLTAVLTHLFLDWRNSLWGRWRPSAAAERMGPIGIRLDELLHRDGCTLREAREMLRSAGCACTDRELNRMAAELPARRAAHELSLDSLAGSVHEAAAAVPVDPADVHGLRALRDALDTLRPEDQMIVRLRFWDGVSIADIAKTLRLEAKPLYRRLEWIERQLRDRLAATGVDRERARDLLSPEVAW